MASKATIRIFISSPSDVRPERLIAERVIARLDQEFGHRVRVEALLWEREPLVASRHFQDIGNIPAPHTADIVVVIVWSRLGVLLPTEQFRGAISGRPVTGTEWEFEDALASARKDGTPPILFYRKQAESTTGLSDRAALQEKIEQLDRVDDFIGRWFRGTDGETASAAWHSFSTTGEFEDRVYEHLHALLTKRLAGESGDTVRWQGSPFRGLESFEFEHAPVFFGRTRARSELREALARQSSKGSAFVLVLGASGSGKSSLVKAGLIPDLMLPGMIGRVALCRRAVLRPGDQPDDLMRGLAAAIMAPTALPELAQLRYTPERLADLLREAPKQAILPIEQGLAEAAKAAALTEIAEARLVLLVDQLEELFTIQTINEEQRNAFVAALVIAWIQRNRAETSYAATFESTTRNFQIIDETLPTSSLPTEVAQRFLDNGLNTLKALGHDLDEAPRPERSSPAIAVLQLRLLALRAQTYIGSGRGREAIETATTMNKFAAAWAAAFPNNDEIQFLLAVSFDRVGDGRNASGDIIGALDAYRRQEAIVTRMLAAQPDNDVLQHRLFFALELIGDAQKWLGETAAALESYQRAEPIALRVTGKRPDDLVWQRDLGTLLPRIGDVLLAQGDVDGAIKRYQATHDLYLRLTKAQPRSADWRWGLMAAHRSIGDAKRASGDLDGAMVEYKAFQKIASRLVDEDDQRLVWKRLLGHAYQRQGDILLAQGKLEPAVTAYADYLSLVEPLARADRDNNNYHNDVSIGHARLGDVFMRVDRVDEAFENYESYLERSRMLAKKVPVHALWQRNWAIAHQRLGDALLARNEPDKALEHFRACVAISVKHPVVDEANPEPRHVIQHCGQRIEQIAARLKQP